MLKSEWYTIAKNNVQNTITAEYREPRQSKTSETSLGLSEKNNQQAYQKPGAAEKEADVRAESTRLHTQLWRLPVKRQVSLHPGIQMQESLSLPQHTHKEPSLFFILVWYKFCPWRTNPERPKNLCHFLTPHISAIYRVFCCPLFSHFSEPVSSFPTMTQPNRF